jgi:hypothetical protein
MYDCLIYIPFKEISSLEHVGSMWSAVSIMMIRAHQYVSGVIDTAQHWSADHCSSATKFVNKIYVTDLLAKKFEKIVWSAVSLTSPNTGQRYH